MVSWTMDNGRDFQLLDKSVISLLPTILCISRIAISPVLCLSQFLRLSARSPKKEVDAQDTPPVSKPLPSTTSHA